MDNAELPLYTPSNDAPAYAAVPQGDEQRLDISVNATEVQGTLPQVSDTPVQAEPTTARTEGIRIVLERQKQENKAVAVYRQNEVVKGEVLVDTSQGVKAVSIKLEGRQAVTVILEETLRDRAALFSVEYELWNAKCQNRDGSGCPSRHKFAIAFPPTFEDGKRACPLPPSFSGRWPGGPLIIGSVSYAVTVVVKKQHRFGWWDKDVTISEPVLYRPRSRPPLPTPDCGPPFLSLTKQVPHEWCHITTSVPTHQAGVGPIDCHLFIPAGRTYAFDVAIPFQLQLHAPMNHLLAAQGVKSPEGVTHFAPLPSTCENAEASTATASARTTTLRTPLSVLGALPQKIAGKQTGSGAHWVRVYLQRRITSKIYGQDAWRTVIIGEAQLGSMTTPEDVDALAWEGKVVCPKKPHVIFSGFSTNRFEIKDSIVLHVKPSNPEISPWREHRHSHPVHLVTDPYSAEA